MTKTHTASTMKNEWIEIIGASDEQLTSYAKQYAIPDDYLSGVNDEFEIARMEEPPHQAGQRPTLVLLQYMLAETGPSGFPEFNTHAISLIDTGDKIITALGTIPDILNALFSEFRYLDYLSYEIMVLSIFEKIQTEIVEGLGSIHREIEVMQKDIQSSSKNKELYRLIALDKSLSSFKTAVQNNRDVLELLTKSSRFNESAELLSMMHDVLIESYQAESMVDEGMRLVDLLNDVFSNVISNNLNNILRVLTSITVVLTIPMVISGLWGMNVPVPFGEHPFGFILLLVIVILISIAVMVWLLMKDYL